MPKEYRTIQEVSGPLMLVREVEGMTVDALQGHTIHDFAF